MRSVHLSAGLISAPINNPSLDRRYILFWIYNRGVINKPELMEALSKDEQRPQAFYALLSTIRRLLQARVETQKAVGQNK